MAYNALNNLIDAYIYANGVQAITGQILNGVLKQMVAQLGGGYNIMGVAVPASSPAVNDEPQAYFAATAGTYTNFDGIVLAAGEVAVLITSGNGSWSKQTIYNVPTGTADLENTADFITNAVTDLVNYYTKTEIDGQKSVTDAALANRYTKTETDTKLADYYKKSETYDKDEVDSIIAALSRQEYIVAWDGLAAPDVSAIPAGVTVTYSGTPYTGTLVASASTVNKIYMVWNGIAYDMYATSQDGGYSWVPMGTTNVDLSQYAKKEEVEKLAQIIVGAWESNPDHQGIMLALYLQVQGWPGFTFKVIPISGARTLQVKANEDLRAEFSLVKTFTEPAPSGTTPMDFATGETERHLVDEGLTGPVITLPSDANYLIINSLAGDSGDRKPDAILLDGVNIMDGIQKEIADLKDAVASSGDELKGEWDANEDHAGDLLANYMQVQGYAGYTHKAIPLDGVSTLQIKANSSIRSEYVIVKSYTPPASSGTTPYDLATGETERRIVNAGATGPVINLPEDANFLLINSLYGSPDASAKPDGLYFDGENVVDGIIEKVNDLSERCLGGGDTSYRGSKRISFNVQDDTFLCKRTRIMSQTAIEAGDNMYQQGMVIIDGKILSFTDTTDSAHTGFIYDLSSGAYVGTIDVANIGECHCNSAQFTDVYYEDGDDYPLMFLSECMQRGNLSYNKLYIIRFEDDGSNLVGTIVKTITPSSEIIGAEYGCNCAYNPVSKEIVVMTNTFPFGSVTDQTNKTNIYVFDCPDLLDGNPATLSGAKKHFFLPYCIWQSMFVKNGMLIPAVQKVTIINGDPITMAWPQSMLQFINLDSGVVEAYLPLDRTIEPEGNCFYGNSIYVAFHKGDASGTQEAFRVERFDF